MGNALLDLPNYSIETIIGQNPNKIIYRAIRESDGEIVAVKTHAIDYPSLKELANLQHEYRILQKIHAAEIPKAYEFIHHKHHMYLVLEYIPGVTLKNFIHEKIKLELGTFYPIAIQLVTLLEELHKQGIIHKDFNATNLIVNPKSLKVNLIDFSLSTELSNEIPSSQLEGTLPYISPEQTGRTNRSVDFRSDFYSLGVTLYEMLTGALPFQSDDPLELVFFHLTKPPPAIPGVPPLLEKLVWKLMAKNAEDRYASAAGIKADLKRIMEGESDFILGEEDSKRAFLLSQKLYGRESQANQILSHFDHFLHTGESELFLVKGPSGMGKTILIQEVQKPLVGNKGIFVKGKYDILQKSVPYLGFSQAIKELVQFLLKEDNLPQIKKELQDALGSVGRAIVDIVPEFEMLMTHLPLLEPLPPKESLARLQFTFQRFFRIIAKKEHPLVLFFDDLQGVDQASLALIEDLLSSTKHLFILGAYRDNEVSSVHPLSLALQDIPNKSIITVTPLNLENVESFIRDTLKIEDVADLAKQVLDKTSGNPFFVTEFLKTLHRDGLIFYKDNRWAFNLEQIKKAPITDNVIDLLTTKIHSLHPRCLETICIAACIGGSFELKTLAAITAKKETILAEELWEAVQVGLLLTEGTEYKQAELGENIAYKFLHDKVQEAAYKVVSLDTKAIHLKIARHLQQQDFPLFELVDHYNRATDLIESPEERQNVSALNLKAAIKAKFSNAYNAALQYIQVARQLAVTPNFEIEREYGECLSLAGQFDEADKQLNQLLKAAPTPDEKLKIYVILAAQNSSLGKFPEAISQSISGLKLIGLSIPEKPNNWNLIYSFMIFKISLLYHGKEKLMQKPLVEDPQYLLATQFIGIIGAISYVTNEQLLFATVIIKAILFGINRGINAINIIGFGGYVISLVRSNQFNEAIFWEKLALKYAEKLNSNLVNGRINFLYGSFYSSWFIRLKDSIPIFLKAVKYSIESGDFTYLAYENVVMPSHFLFLNKSLEEGLNEFKKALIILKRSKEEGFFEMVGAIHSILQTLMDSKQNILDIDLEHLLRFPNRNAKHRVFFFYGLVLFIKGDLKKARETMIRAREFEDSTSGQLLFPLATYLDALISCRFYKELSKKEKKLLDRNFNLLKIWSEQFPANFNPLYLHIVAELAIQQGDEDRGKTFFDRALDAAEEEELLLFSALISESAFQYYFRTDQKRLAKFYFQIAHYHYLQWGAKDKIQQLEERYPAWIGSGTFTSLASSMQTSTTGSPPLDLMSLMKATQALSSEIILSTLLEKMVKIVMENAGAHVVKILIEHGDTLALEAEGSQNGEVSLYEEKPINETIVPISIVNYVLRSKQSVILHDASKHAEQFQQDPYLIKNAIKSLLCTPILHQSKAIGVLYLENNLAPDVFTEQRAGLLNVLASQAAISLENARLYKAYDRFVPTQILKVLGKRNLVDIKLGDQVPCMMTALVCDIRNFTSLSEAMTSQETFAYLNNFLGAMEPIIRVHHGFIDKYIGDAIMALFPGDPDDALNAAIDMLHHLPPEVKVGIGLNTGELILGILGGKDRIDGSVIGDSVNIAFRIQDLTKSYKIPLLLTENTKQLLKHPSDYNLRLVDEVFVKGKAKPISIWAVGDLKI